MYSKNLNTKILVIKNLNFKFSSTHKPFFENANIEFNAGEMHFIKGKNGIGKSVFFRILQGNVTRNEILSADITFENKQFNITTQNKIPTGYATKTHMVKQNFNAMIADQFSFKDNLKFANIGSYPLFSNLPKHKLLPAFLNKFQIDYDTPSCLLSGGQRQILAILMILQKPCKILLLDEPTSALDEQNANIVMDFLNELVTQTKLTTLIISHDNELVEKYAHGDFYEIISNQTTEARNIMHKTGQ